MSQPSLFGAAPPGVACVDLPAFPLQLVLRAHPEWREDPVVVVEEDRPLAHILWANRPARDHRIRRGMKFGQAQSLVARLHGQVVTEEEAGEAHRSLFELLLELTPNVEPETPGRYWLDPRGLAPLYGSLENWAGRVHRRLTEREFVGSVVVGWQRGPLLAIARTEAGARVLPSLEEEDRAAHDVPLTKLDLPPKLLESLTVLGVRTFGEFRALPPAGLRTRYGEDAARWHALARGEAWTPLQAEHPVPPVAAELAIEPPDSDHARLLFGIKGVLHDLLDRLDARSEGVLAILLTLELDHAPAHEERLLTASPTRNAVRLLDLIRLRLGAIRLEAPVERIRLVLESRRVSGEQSEMLRDRPKRDLREAAATLARLRARFGGDSVVRARLREAPLPEDRFTWEPLREVDWPAPAPPDGESPLIRALRPEPLRLPDPPRHERERWLGTMGAVESLQGPGRVSTGWWERRTERDYYWARTKTGAALWLFRDRADRGWWLHGAVD